jgi:hypothetical protein
MRAMNLPLLPPAPASPQEWTDLFLSRLDRGSVPFPDASHLLVAYAAWPNDRELRDHFMATNIGLAVAHLERRLVLTASTATPLTEGENLSGRTPLELFGGWEAVAETALSAVGDRLNKVQDQWPKAADIFHMIVDIANEKRVEVRGGPSISKAIDLLEDAKELPGQSQLRVAWSRFRDVAHVLTAGAYLAHCALERGDKRAQSILSAMLFVPDVVLLLAGAFQQFGLATTPHGQKTPILNPATLWRVPESHLPENLPLPVRTLTSRHIELLQERRAPKKYKPSLRGS